MPECDNPLWPCAMTGAVACLAGFEGITVIIHGSSGCYYYPATLLHAPLEGTFIMEQEVIFGSEERLREVIAGVAGNGKRTAVVTTCVPAILGEDIRSVLAAHDSIIVDSPGFSGDLETGYRAALEALGPSVDPPEPCVNIDGICLLDPFFRGNLHEILRLLRLASVPVGTIFCSDSAENVNHASPYTIGTNGDFASGVGEFLGGTLGLDTVAQTITEVCRHVPESDPDPVIRETEREKERVIRACDKFLRRFDPPRVAIFAGLSYARFAEEALHTWLDAEILCIGTRNDPGGSPGHITRASGMNEVKALLEDHRPDLVLGSSFEQSAGGSYGFVGITPPLRGRVSLAPRTLAGITGTLSLIENVLNECMDSRKSTAPITGLPRHR
ncbi:MAG TPA: nitrogenase component 1 [Methanoregula sp.]|nr:nitrogenase component 1 [Methanoregula sp.]